MTYPSKSVLRTPHRASLGNRHLLDGPLPKSSWKSLFPEWDLSKVNTLPSAFMVKTNCSSALLPNFNWNSLEEVVKRTSD